MSNVRPPKFDARPTRNDVAKLANISGTTVSRVLSGRTDIAISPAVRERVLEAARELGYRPNSAAQALRSGRAGLVGFWMCLQYSRYRAQVLAQMREVLAHTQLAMAVTDVDDEYEWDHSFSRALRVPVDGIIAFDASASVEAFARSVDQLAPNLPFVSMGAYWSEEKSYVGVDLKGGTEAAMDHLFETGRRRIAYVAPWNSGLLTYGPRYEGYRAKMEAAGLEMEMLSIEYVTLDSIHAAFVERQAKGNFPDAFLCMSDDIALEAIPALERMGLQAGREAAVIGFNGTEGTERGPVPLTTVRQPIEQMCAVAYDFLRAQMEDVRTEHQGQVLKPELIIRASTTG